MNPKVEELLNAIDLAEVNKAIMDTGIKPWDVDSIIERIMSACDLWLLEDLRAGKILVEQEYDLVSKGILDLILIPDKEGVCGIVDWKTTGNLKRPNFVEEIKGEFQSSLYLAHGGDWIEREYGVRPQYIEYRALDEQGEFKSFRVQWDEKLRTDANAQIGAISTLYNALTDSYDSTNYGGTEKCWPRNRPRACFIGSKGGPTCPYYDDCTSMTMPPVAFVGIDFESLKPRSKSSMKSFLECPERFRRTKILGDVGHGSDAISAGEAFHAGMESIYKQVLAL